MTQQYFKDKKILITGAASGIGQDLAQLLASYGSILALADIQPITPFTESHHHYQVDVTNRHDMQQMCDDLLKRWSTVDIVIAAAGVGGLNPGENFSIELDHKIVSINYFGTVHSLVPFIESMKKNGKGQLVGICSLAGLRGLPAAASYSASKAAQMTFLESLRIDLKKFGISVSCIHPGFVKTPMANHSEFDMPFTVSVRESTHKILKSIYHKDSQSYYPFPMSYLSRLNRLLPNWFYDFLMPKIGGVKTTRPQLFSALPKDKK